MRTKIFNVFKDNPECEFTLDEVCARYPKLTRNCVSQVLFHLESKRGLLEKIRVEKLPGQSHPIHRWKFRDVQVYDAESLFMVGGETERKPRTKKDAERVKSIKKKVMGIEKDRSKIDTDYLASLVQDWTMMSNSKPDLQQYINSRI